MSNFQTGTLSAGSTGNKSFTGFGFKPSYLRFTISQRLNTTENFLHFSQGFADGVVQYSHSIFQDSSGGKTQAFNTRCVNHKNRVDGTVTDIIKATLVSFDPDGFTLNFTAADANYQIYVEAFS